MVMSRNSVGFSPLSSPITILVAQIPSAPSSPVTTISGANVLITWTAPYSGASRITSYTISVLASNGTYLTDIANCNGGSVIVVASQSCSIPSDVLMTIPYNLQYGDSVFAHISATNIIGTSGVSASGNGAVLLTVPYAPVNLANLPLITSGSKIGIIWQAGAMNGGAPVLDYTVSWDNATGFY